MLRRKRQGFFKIGGADDLQHGAEDFFLVAFHVGGDMVEQGWANKVAFFMPLKFEPAAIDDQLAAFVNAGLDPAFNLCLMLRGDNRAVMRLGIG